MLARSGGMITKLLALAVLASSLSGCLAASVAGAAVDVTGAVVGATVHTTGAVIGAAIPDGDDDEEKGQRRR
jgi:hypothetical protein